MTLTLKATRIARSKGCIVRTGMMDAKRWITAERWLSGVLWFIWPRVKAMNLEPPPLLS
jgi:hypothetical protein